MICDKAQIPLLTVFSRILMSMNKLSHDGKDKVITFLSSIAFIFVGNDKENFDYSTLKSAKKAIFKYVDETSNFLSLQALVETMFVFVKQGIEIEKILPKNCSILVEMLNDISDKTDLSTISTCCMMSQITRKLIMEGNEKNIEIFELANEKFMIDAIPAGRDKFLYYHKKDDFFSHQLIFDTGSVYLEKVKLDEVQIFEAELMLKTDYWTFTLKSKQMMNNIKERFETQFWNPSCKASIECKQQSASVDRDSDCYINSIQSQDASSSRLNNQQADSLPDD